MSVRSDLAAIKAQLAKRQLDHRDPIMVIQMARCWVDKYSPLRGTWHEVAPGSVEIYYWDESRFFVSAEHSDNDEYSRTCDAYVATLPEGFTYVQFRTTPPVSADSVRLTNMGTR